MYKVRLPIIWRDYKTTSEEEELRMRVLGQDPEPTKRIGTVVIDLDMVESWYTDKEGTRLCLTSGDHYIVDVREEMLSVLWTELTSMVIKTIEYQEGDQTVEEGGDYGDN